MEKFFPFFVKALKDSGNGEFLGKSGVSWVDFHMANNVLTIKNFAPDTLKNFPEIEEHCKRIHKLPELQKYLSSRNETKL